MSNTPKELTSPLAPQLHEFWPLPKIVDLRLRDKGIVWAICYASSSVMGIRRRLVLTKAFLQNSFSVVAGRGSRGRGIARSLYAGIGGAELWGVCDTGACA